MRIKRLFSNILLKVLGPVYYRFFFNTNRHGAKQAASWVTFLECRAQSEDIPASKGDWESKYTAGRWDYMESSGESERYSSIIGFLGECKPMAAVLDVGCGSGTLLRMYLPIGYARYVGIDISEIAIQRAGKQDEKTIFLIADAETFEPPGGAFDAIVYNETLYYFHNPLAVVRRYSKFLKEDGVMIVSTYTGSQRANAILRHMKKIFKLSGESVVTRGSVTWVCSVFSPAFDRHPERTAI